MNLQAISGQYTIVSPFLTYVKIYLLKVPTFLMGEKARLSWALCTDWVVCTPALCLAFLLWQISQVFPSLENPCLYWIKVRTGNCVCSH